jgi:hypothetical protein
MLFALKLVGFLFTEPLFGESSGGLSFAKVFLFCIRLGCPRLVEFAGSHRRHLQNMPGEGPAHQRFCTWWRSAGMLLSVSVCFRLLNRASAFPRVFSTS